MATSILLKQSFMEKAAVSKGLVTKKSSSSDNGQLKKNANYIFDLGVVGVGGHKVTVHSRSERSLHYLINMLNKSTCTKKDCDDTSTTETTLLSVHWLEIEAVAGFRVWQIMFLCFAGVLTIIVVLCCCIRFRIPRTKQEIEADYIRKKITKKFQKQLRMIQNSDMDDMDLKRALDRIRAEFKSDTESLAQSDALSGATLSSGNYRLAAEGTDKNFPCSETYRKASYLGISLEEIMEKERRRPTLRTLAGMLSKFRPRSKAHNVLD